MAQRPIWRGILRLALVSCPVALYSTQHDRGAIKLDMINPDTGNRIRMVTQDAETGVELQRRDLVKGYEFKKNKYVLIEDSDLESVKVESSSMMAIEKFVEGASIDPIYYDASYYLAPDGKGAEDVYAVLREAIIKTGMVALTRVVISQRERTVALRATEDGMVAHTLNEERDLNAAKPLFEDVHCIKTDPEMVALAVQLIGRQAGQYDPADLEDRYETRLRAMLDAKLSGSGIVSEDVERPESNVVDLMQALRKSLGNTPVAAPSPSRPAAKRAKKSKAPDVRDQPGLKLPIAGGRKSKLVTEPIPAAPARGKRSA